MRLTLTLLLLLLGAAPARAPDFWIEPSSFRLAAGAPVSASLRVGMGLRGEVVPRQDSRIVRFALVGPSAERPLVGRDGADPAGLARVTDPGLYWMAYLSDASTVELDAAKIATYVEEEGLEPFLKLHGAGHRRGAGIRPGAGAASGARPRARPPDAPQRPQAPLPAAPPGEAGEGRPGHGAPPRRPRAEGERPYRCQGSGRAPARGIKAVARQGGARLPRRGAERLEQPVGLPHPRDSVTPHARRLDLQGQLRAGRDRPELVVPEEPAPLVQPLSPRET